MIDIITLRGAGEARNPHGSPLGMTGSVARSLNPEMFTFYEPDWPASVGPVGAKETKGPSLNSSVSKGADSAAKAIRRSPNVCGIIAYSLGALTASVLLEGIHGGIYTNSDGSPLEVAFALLIANPARRPFEHKFEPCPGYGIHGKRGSAPDSTDIIEACNPQDVICSAPELSPLRGLSDGISPFSLLEGARLGDVDKQFREIRSTIKNTKAREALYHFWSPEFWDRYAKAIDGAGGYLFRGDHTNYDSRIIPGKGKTHVQMGADYINERWG